MRTPDGYQQVVAPTSLLFANGDTSGYDHASPSSAFATFPFNPAEEVRFDITAKSADTSASSGIVLGVPQTGRFNAQIGILYQNGRWMVWDYGAQETLATVEGSDAASAHLARVIGFNQRGFVLTLTDAEGNVQQIPLSVPLATTGNPLGFSVQAGPQSTVDGKASVDAPANVKIEPPTPGPYIVGTGPYAAQLKAIAGALPDGYAIKARITPSGGTGNTAAFNKHINGVELLGAHVDASGETIMRFVFYGENGDGPYYFNATAGTQVFPNGKIFFVGSPVPDGRVDVSSLSKGEIFGISVMESDVNAILRHDENQVVTIIAAVSFTAPSQKDALIPLPPASQ